MQTQYELYTHIRIELTLPVHRGGIDGIAFNACIVMSAALPPTTILVTCGPESVTVQDEGYDRDFFRRGRGAFHPCMRTPWNPMFLLFPNDDNFLRMLPTYRLERSTRC